MSLPLPAGPDYPLWMPPDGLMDRTGGVITDRPRTPRQARRSALDEATYSGSSRADELVGRRPSLST